MFDASSQLGADELESMIEDGLYRRLFTMHVLESLVERVAHPCRDGSALITRTLAERGSRLRPVASDLELRLERAMRRRGFPPLRRQVPITLTVDSVIHPDLGIPDDGFFVEIDHARWHSAAQSVDYDTWRDRQLRVQGLWVERVSDRAIEHRLGETVEDLWRAWCRARDSRRSSLDGAHRAVTWGA